MSRPWQRRPFSEQLRIYPTRFRSVKSKVRQMYILQACKHVFYTPLSDRVDELLDRLKNGSILDRQKKLALIDTLFCASRISDDAHEYDKRDIETPKAWAEYIERYLPLADTDEVRALVLSWEEDVERHLAARK
jgi:hypothetical protein